MDKSNRPEKRFELHELRSGDQAVEFAVVDVLHRNPASEADLRAILAHVRELVVLDGDAWTRTFTVKELVRRGREHGPRPYRQYLRGWAAKVSTGRTIRDLLGESVEGDVAYPFGGSDADYRRTVAELDALGTELGALL